MKELPKELEGYIKEYLKVVQNTPYAKNIILKGSKDVIGNIKKYWGKSLTVKMLPMSMDKDEAPNLFINLHNLVKECENLVRDTYSRNIVNNRKLAFAFKIETFPRADILNYISTGSGGEIQSFPVGSQSIYIFTPSKRLNLNIDIDYSYLLLFCLISYILQKIRNVEKSQEPTEFDWEVSEEILKSFTIYAYAGLSSTDIYEIELSDISWLYKNYFKKDKNPFVFIEKVLNFVVDSNKDKIIVAILNKLIYVFLNYRKVDEELFDLLYDELFKRAKTYLKEIPDPSLIMMDELENLYIKGYGIGKAFRNKNNVELVEKVVLALKSERDPESFRDKLLNYLITGKIKDIILPEEFFKKNLSKKEFLAMKDAFLAGLWNGAHIKSYDESSSN